LASRSHARRRIDRRDVGVSLEAIAIDALLAMSLWVTLDTRKYSLAGPGFMALGAYAAALVAPRVHGAFVPCALVAALIAAAAGALTDRCVARLNAVGYSIATVAVAFFLPALLFTRTMKGGFPHAAADATTAVAWAVAGAAALALARCRWRFAAGAGAAGVAGALFCASGGALDPAAFGIDRIGVMVAVAMVGGVGSPVAPLLGAALLALLVRLALPLTHQPSIVDGVALLFVLVYLPDGAWPSILAATQRMARRPTGAPDGAS
jgi:branched-chain amino acid transport system permease protein